MAVGGGDVSSVPAVCLTLVLLWSFVQLTAPWWLRSLAKRSPESHVRLRLLDKALTLVPALLLFAGMLDLTSAYMTQDLSYSALASAASIPGFTFTLGFALSAVVIEHKFCRQSLLDGGDEADLRARTLRWYGILWLVLLLGIVPSDDYAVNSLPLESSAVVEFPGELTLMMLIAGIMLAAWANLESLASKLRLTGVSEISRICAVAAVAVCALLVYDSGIHGTAFDDGFAESVALGTASSLAVVIAFSVLLFGWPLYLHLLTRVHAARGQAQARRFLGLGRTFGHTLVFTWASGVVILEPLPNVSGWHSAMWLSFTLLLPLALAGLVGTLLPMAGLDSLPRPEAWGFYLGMTLACLLFTTKEPLTAALVPGLFVSMVALPLLATHPEQRPDLPVKRRGLESASIITLSIVVLWAFHRFMDGEPLLFLAGIGTAILLPLAAASFVKPTREVNGTGEDGIIGATGATGKEGANAAIGEQE